MSCSDCFQGHVMNDYQPKGEVVTIHNRSTYVARPPNNTAPKGIIIIIPDAFGQPFPNNKHLADTYAADGSFLTYLPDFMDGTAGPAWMIDVMPNVIKTATLWDWISKPYWIALSMYGLLPFLLRNGFGTSMPKVQAFFEAVRDNEATEMNIPIGAAGFCWGGQHTFALSSGEYKSSKSGKVLCDAHFTAHASNLKLPDDAKKVILPLSMAQGTNDPTMPVAKVHEIEAIFREKTDKEGIKNLEVVVYEGAGHGFGVRADPWSDNVMKHADESVKQAINFYNRVFASLKSA